MSLLFSKRAADLNAFADPYRPLPNSSTRAVGREQALRVSAVWACLRLRADLISTLPVDVYRKVGDLSVEVSKPPLFVAPGGSRMLWHDWMYATQFDLDRYGNTFGQIVGRDGSGRPAQIELSDASEWSVRVDTASGAVEYRRQGKLLDSADVWHERQFVVAGLPVGLSPIAYAAWTLAHNLSAQEFAVNWFESGASPTGTLRHTAEEHLDPKVADSAKKRFKVATANRDIFVTGKEWEYTPAAAAASDAKFLDAMKATTVDVCRYLGVPGDMIDAETATGSITYANVTQRNLQLLIMNLGPAIVRRERVFSHYLVSSPRFVKFNTDALLRMDLKAKIETLGAGIDKRIYTPNHARGLLDLPPLTEADYAEFDRLFPSKSQPALKTGTPQ